VVASEVKALATQTAQSAQQIAQHIGEVRTATGASAAVVVRAAGLNTAVEELRHTVIRVVRTSATEVDRRHYPGYRSTWHVG